MVSVESGMVFTRHWKNWPKRVAMLPTETPACATLQARGAAAGEAGGAAPAEIAGSAPAACSTASPPGRPTRAAAIGAGHFGLEVAEQLRRRGLDVTVVKRESHRLPFLGREMAEAVGREIEARGVRLAPGRGFAATDAFMRMSDPAIYAAGDAVDDVFGPTGGEARVPPAGIAARAGRSAGEHAATGSSASASAAWGVSVVRAFGRTAGATGLSLRAAAAAGLTAPAAHVVGHHRASCDPGAEILALKLVDEVGGGRAPGAQAVGGAGVDERLDVVSTPMRFRGAVHDLGALDLAHAPPFGSAKDLVHMAAFVDRNDLDGRAPLVRPADDLCGFQVVGVSESEEAAPSPMVAAPHAVSIPLAQLRDALDPTRPALLACRTGLRSCVGVRILAQRGFRDVRDLTGGDASPLAAADPLCRLFAGRLP
jgi:rhodanese-related sulfurtransferase